MSPDGLNRSRGGSPRIDARRVRKADVLDDASGGFRHVVAPPREVRGSGRREGGVLMGVEGHEEAGVLGERMRVRSRQRGDQGWIVPTAGPVLPTAPCR